MTITDMDRQTARKLLHVLMNDYGLVAQIHADTVLQHIAHALAEAREEAEALGYVAGQTEGMELRNRAYTRIANLVQERDDLKAALAAAKAVYAPTDATD